MKNPTLVKNMKHVMLMLKDGKVTHGEVPLGEGILKKETYPNYITK